MANVSSVVLNYAVRGADRAQRKDKQVRESIQRTGREARKQQGTIRRWMQRHQTAIAGIAAATAGAMLAVVKHSPTLRGELAGLRLAFSLFAMTVGEDVAPELNGLSDTALDLQDAYSDLPGAIRKPISALIGFGLAAAVVVTALAGLETVISGTAVAGALGTIAAYASAAAGALAGLATGTAGVIAAIVGLLALGGLVVSELLGITNATKLVSESQNDLVRAASNLLFFFLGPFIGAFATVYAFWKGGWSNAKRVALRFIDETGKAFLRFLIGLGAGVAALAATLHTGFETAWALAKSATIAGVNGIMSYAQGGINDLIEVAYHAREILPAVFTGMWNQAKQATASALNAILSRTESAVNDMIRAANRLPKIDLDTVSVGRVDFGGGPGVGEMTRGAARRARRQARENAVDFDMLPRSTFDEILSNAGSRLSERMERLRNQEAFLKNERFGRESIQLEPPGSSAPDQGPTPTDGQQPVEDNSVNIEEFRVEQQSTGDSEFDGEQAGRAAMEYIEERQNQRQ